MQAKARKDTPRTKARRKAARQNAPARKKAAPKRAQAERMVTAKTTAKTATLNIRIDVDTRDLVDRAADVSGQNRTDYMLTVLRERSIEVLLTQRLFTLNSADWASFVERLDDPPPPNAKLKALLAREPIWDRQ